MLAMLFIAPAWANSPEVLKQWNGDKIEWLEFEEGATKARNLGRPMFVVFHATWCPHCARYREQFFDARVTEMAGELVMVIVDIDESPNFNSSYERFGGYVPRTMILSEAAEHIVEIRGSNQEYWYFIDTGSPDELIRVLKEAVSAGG